MDSTTHGGHAGRSDPSASPHPLPHPPTINATSKRRARTVSNLTQEQVRKKRDNDREAQRAFRERTKTRIHVLENELVELKAERREQERSNTTQLQALIEDNRALRSQIKRLTQLARPLVSLLASDIDDPGGGVDHVSLLAHRSPGDAGATNAIAHGLADATNASPLPSTQSNIQHAKEMEGTRSHPSPQSLSQYNAMTAQTSNFAREHHQQDWLRVRNTNHERHTMMNIAQDVDMGVEAQAGTQACTYPESLPHSAGVSPSGGNDYLAQDDRSPSSTTHQPQDNARYSAVTADGSHGTHMHYSNASDNRWPNQSADRTLSNTGLVHASSPQQSTTPAYRVGDSGNYPLYP